MSALHSTSHASQDIQLHWTALFVDEAAQATEPDLLIVSKILSGHSLLRSC